MLRMGSSNEPLQSRNTTLSFRERVNSLIFQPGTSFLISCNNVFSPGIRVTRDATAHYPDAVTFQALAEESIFGYPDNSVGTLPFQVITHEKFQSHFGKIFHKPTLEERIETVSKKEKLRKEQKKFRNEVIKKKAKVFVHPFFSFDDISLVGLTDAPLSFFQNPEILKESGFFDQIALKDERGIPRTFESSEFEAHHTIARNNDPRTGLLIHRNLHQRLTPAIQSYYLSINGSDEFKVFERTIEFQGITREYASTSFYSRAPLLIDLKLVNGEDFIKAWYFNLRAANCLALLTPSIVNYFGFDKPFIERIKQYEKEFVDEYQSPKTLRRI
jgi:hypothetical protein